MDASCDVFGEVRCIIHVFVCPMLFVCYINLSSQKEKEELQEEQKDSLENHLGPVPSETLLKTSEV